MNLSIRSKLFLISLLLLVVPTLIVGMIGYQQSKYALDQMGQVTLQNAVKQTIGLIKALDEEVKEGHISLEEAQERVKVAILGEKTADGKRPIQKEINLGPNGYLYILDEKGLLLAHPSLEGQSLWELQDADGTFFIQEVVKQARNGGGFTHYPWELPGQSDLAIEQRQIAPKIVYSAQDPYWGWVVVSGSYMMDYNSGADAVLYALLVVLSVCLLIGIIFISLFSRQVSRPLIQMSAAAKRVSEGDLTVEPLKVASKDELGQLASGFNTMMENMRDLLTKVVESTHHVASTSEQLSASAEQTGKAAEQITQSIQEIATGSETQLSGVEKTERAVHEITDGIRHIATTAAVVAEASAHSAVQAEAGNHSLQKVVQQMESITRLVGESDHTIMRLLERSAEIGEILEVIRGIAGQTNMLALNAAIEAARAGELGKGFAVVADEVRKLAEQSEQSSQKIADLIHEIQEDTSASAVSMGQIQQEVGQGMEAVSDTEGKFRAIVESLQQVSEQVKEVSAVAGQMSANTEHVSATVGEITRIARDSADSAQNVAAAGEEQLASMEEITSSSHTLAQMAEELGRLVGRFRVS
ncbi:methyl-accepting chemotaxis protein [Brevibacillus humidisoli]|uniref:methyl-accepting chemotaxis protein n=1 Tax=Brevibacillus humidisoli TaxID=2895522 RepID=UPI001E3D76B8|nr:methyl-accepting chemotaxis protein [Brevibacillus humidisoli]UFJ40573.1 methyl-accepting chemotaxis protein [Brevibacillus humidisoli]